MLASASYRQIMEDGPFFSILIPPLQSARHCSLLITLRPATDRFESGDLVALVVTHRMVMCQCN